jgi:hypothetical protein
MGTRGFWGFIHNGVERITYNHFDSYPSALGEDLLAWAREADWNKVREQVKNLTIVDESSTPNEDERLKFAGTHENVSSGDDWYSYLRGNQGDPQKTLDSGYMIDSHDFPLDSLFAEWGYIFDLDAETLDVYRGFQKTVPSAGRWAGRPTTEEDAAAYVEHVEWCKAQDPPREPWMPQESAYKAVRMVATFPLDALPDPALFNAEANEETAHL